ncbi:cation channel sperm-associated auxiliary subunit epsilon [Ctenodactylus gundi]
MSAWEVPVLLLCLICRSSALWRYQEIRRSSFSGGQVGCALSPVADPTEAPFPEHGPLQPVAPSPSSRNRYASNSLDYRIVSTRSTIKLEYEGTLFSEWSVPETCTIKDKRSPRTEMRCSSPGFQNIKPIVTGPDKEEERYLSVDKSYICFLWYFTVRTWHFSLPMMGDDILKFITGNPVTFLDCFVADFTFLLNVPVLILPEMPGFLPISSPPGSQLMVSWASCMPSVSVVVADMETFHTNDSFVTWTRVRVPPNILSDDERRSVAAVILLRDKMYFLINGIVYQKDWQGFKKLGRQEKLPEGGIIGIATRRWCWVQTLLTRKRRKSIITVWTKHEIYFGYYTDIFDKLITTTELKHMLNLSSASTLTIHSVEYTGHSLELSVFLNYCIKCTKTKKVYMLIYNENSRAWTYQNFVLDVTIDTFLVPRFLFSAVPELILWDKHSIYYFYQNFTVTGVLQTPSGHGNLSALSHGSIIHDVFLDYYGNILTKMENNIMFYTKHHVGDVVKLHVWTNEAIKSSFCVNERAEVYFLYVFDDGTIEPHKYPLQLEVESVIFKTKEKCPYIAFHNNISRYFYFLDKGENLSVWAEVAYPENAGMDIIMETYGPKILEWKQTSNYEVALGYCTRTMFVTFYQDVNYEAVNDYFSFEEQNMGLVFIQFRPSHYSKTCPTAQKVFQIGVGCDTSKFIQVKGQVYSEKDKVKLPGQLESVGVLPLQKGRRRGKKIRYDWERYGCPLKLDANENFQPSIELFDENGFVEVVAVNFILWEIHGRNDYSYTNTMKQSGCLHEAQTWKTMTERNKSLPLEDAWGPQNYRSCFSYAIGKPGDLNQPYEIINISNKNHIYWPLGNSGMYVFRVKIVDPNYSFCNLTAIFAIETIGVIPSVTPTKYGSWRTVVNSYRFNQVVAPVADGVSLLREVNHCLGLGYKKKLSVTAGGLIKAVASGFKCPPMFSSVLPVPRLYKPPFCFSYGILAVQSPETQTRYGGLLDWMHVSSILHQ